MGENVVAQVILVSDRGPTITEAEESITAENVAKYRVGRAVVEAARSRLEHAGFRVLAEGPGTLSIEASRDRFENVFHTRLEPAVKRVDVEGSAHQAPHYRAASPLKIPDDLSDVVAQVVLPEPPDFFV